MVHKKCSGIKGPLHPDPEFKCTRCLRTAWAIEEKFQRLRLETKSLKLSQSSATLGTYSLQEVAVSWLRSHAANVHGASSASCFPFLTIRHLPLLKRGKVFSSCLRSVMLHAAETWAMKVDSTLNCNDSAMIRCICNIRAMDEVSSNSILTKLGIQDFRTSRIRWFGHVEHSTGWVAEVCKLMWLHRKDQAGQGNHGMKCLRMTERS